MASALVLSKQNLVLDVEMRKKVLQIDVFGDEEGTNDGVVDASRERNKGRVVVVDCLSDL